MNYPVSIMIPVYNTEEFIEKCLRSVCEQTLDNFEIVIVDDCSPDNAMSIVDNVLKDYPERKKSTQIIRLEKNVGLASARKIAFPKMRGTYVTCLDSDDYLEHDALEEMLKKAQETDADMVICDFFNTFADDKDVLVSQKIGVDILSDLFVNKLHASYCNKLYKKEILDQIVILDSINMCEDFLAMTQMMFYAKKVVYIEKAFLHYVQYNSNSYTKKISQKSIDDILMVAEFLENFLKNNNVYERYRKEWYHRKLFFKFMVLKNLNFWDRKKYLNIYLEANEEICSLSLYPRLILHLAKRESNYFISLILYIKEIMMAFKVIKR